MKVAIDFKHKPAMCPQAHAITRFMQAEISSDIKQEEDTDDEMTMGNLEHDGNKKKEVNQTLNELFQNNLPNHIQQSQSETEILTSNLLRQYDACNKIDENSTYLDNGSHPYDISDDYELMDLRIRKLQERKHLWSTDNVRKKFSPMVTALIQ